MTVGGRVGIWRLATCRLCSAKGDKDAEMPADGGSKFV